MLSLAICITPVMYAIHLLGLVFSADLRNPPRKSRILLCDSSPKWSETAQSYSSMSMIGFLPTDSKIAFDRSSMDVTRKDSLRSLLLMDLNSSTKSGSTSGSFSRYSWASYAFLTAVRILLRKDSYVATFVSFRSRWITGNAFLYLSNSGCFEISRPSNQSLPLYWMLKKASSMDRLVVFPNLRGRVN